MKEICGASYDGPIDNGKTSSGWIVAFNLYLYILIYFCHIFLYILLGFSFFALVVGVSIIGFHNSVP